MGPFSIVEPWIRSGLVKIGDQLFGYASIECLDCDSRAYFILLRVGFGGWYTETDNLKDVKGLIKLMKSVASGGEALGFVPLKMRTPIEDDIKRR